MEEINKPVFVAPNPNPVDGVVVVAAPKAGADRPGTRTTIMNF